MLVIISDLHLTDGTSGSTISPGAFQLLGERIADLTVGASQRRDGSYRPVERIDLLLLGALVVTGGQWGGEIFPYLLLANPADVFRILNIFTLADVRTMYGLVTVFPPMLADPWLLGMVMIAWIVAPLGIATWRFRQ